MRDRFHNGEGFRARTGATWPTRGILPQLLLVVGILATAPAAQAQQPQQGQEQDTARAEVLFQEGLALTDRGRWPAAEAKLRGALELQPDDDRARYQLARTLVELGEVAEATRHLRAIVYSGAPDPIIREAATELLVETEPRVGRLIVELDGAVDGTTLLIDEVPVDENNAAEGISVDPGPHVVSVTDPEGGPLARRRVDVEPGGAAHLELDVAPTPQAAAQTMVATNQAPRPLDDGGDDEAITAKWWFWTGVGAVVVGAVVTTVALSVGGDTPTEGDAPPVHVGRNGAGVTSDR